MRKLTFLWFVLMALCCVVSVSGCDSTLDTVSGSDSSSDDSEDTAEVTTVSNSDTSETDGDYAWDSAAENTITLNNTGIVTSSSAVSISGTVATIGAAGDYRISGTLDDGQIVVDTTDADTVRLILDGVNITSSTSAAIWVSKAQKVVVVLASGSSNTLTDGSTRDETLEDIPNAALYSTADLILYGDTDGTGSLSVTGAYADGITSKDGLIIKSGKIGVTAADDGIRGKDYIFMDDGTVTVSSSGDGLVSNYDTPADGYGYITISDGSMDIVSGGDGLSATKDVTIAAGSFGVTSGGGSTASLASDASAKAMKAGSQISISGGTFVLNASDDAVHAGGSLTVSGGTFSSVKSGADGFQAEGDLSFQTASLVLVSAGDGLAAGGNLEVDSGTLTISSGGGSSATLGTDASAKAIKAGGTLTLDSGTYTLNSADDAIHSTGALVINGGTFSSITTAGDGIQSESTILFAGAVITSLKSTGDGMAAASTLSITGGTINITSGGGSSGTLGSISAKGIKSDTDVNISGGTITVSSADDSVHSGVNVEITGGTLNLAANTSSGQGIKCGPLATAGAMTISGSSTAITISSSKEGIAGYKVTVSGGTIYCTAKDDGFSISGSTVSGGTENDDGSLLTISGGLVVVTVAGSSSTTSTTGSGQPGQSSSSTSIGDGIDSNGDIIMTGGTVLVNEAYNSTNEPVDFNGSFDIKGGVFVAVGGYNSNMTKPPSSTSTQYSIMAVLSSSQSANTLIHLQDSSGTDLMTFKPSVAYKSVFISSPAMGTGSNFKLYYGGSDSGTAISGLYSTAMDGTYSSSGTYTPGTLAKTFSITSISTTVN